MLAQAAGGVVDAQELVMCISERRGHTIMML